MMMVPEITLLSYGQGPFHWRSDNMQPIPYVCCQNVIWPQPSMETALQTWFSCCLPSISWHQVSWVLEDCWYTRDHINSVFLH